MVTAICTEPQEAPRPPREIRGTALKIQATWTAKRGRSTSGGGVIHRHEPATRACHRPIFFSLHRACGSVCASRSRDFVVVYSVESVLPRPTGVPSALMLSNFKRPMVERSGHPSLPTAFCLGHRYRHRARPLSVHLSDGDASIASNWISRRRCQVELGMVWTEHKTPDNLSLQSPESPPGGLDSCRVQDSRRCLAAPTTQWLAAASFCQPSAPIHRTCGHGLRDGRQRFTKKIAVHSEAGIPSIFIGPTSISRCHWERGRHLGVLE